MINVRINITDNRKTGGEISKIRTPSWKGEGQRYQSNRTWHLEESLLWVQRKAVGGGMSVIPKQAGVSSPRHSAVQRMWVVEDEIWVCF